MFCGLITGLLPGLVGRLGPWWCVFCVRPGPMAVACFGYSWGLLRGCSACCWAWWPVDSSPLFNFNRIFPPFPGARGNLCAETSYLRVQCLCGRADVWGARAVVATILDVFGYGLPTESGVGSQWRYCYCRGREVGNHSEKDMGSLGKFAFIPPSHLKI